MVEAEAHCLTEEREVMEAKHKKAEEENEWLRQEMDELRAGFATQKKELEGEYKKQVDDMFFFDDRCCIKKHGITQETPSYPLDDDDATAGDPARADGDVAKVGPSGRQP